MILDQRHFTRLDMLKILIVLGLAFYITSNLHLDYPYPLHGDEWVHWAQSEAILQANSTTFSEPFFGESNLSPASNLETGFHLYWGISHLVTDISWLEIFMYFPSIIFMITVLIVYVFAEREGFGFEAALFTCLIPTTVGILGPALLVPLSMGLLFIPLSLYVAFNFQTLSSYFILCIITIFLLIMHPPSAAITLTVFVPYILLNIRNNFKHSLGITLALVTPFLVSFAWMFDRFIHEVGTFFTFQPHDTYVSIPSIIQTYGYLPIAFGLLGTVFMLIKGDKNKYGLIFGLLTLLALLVVFSRLHYGSSILYQRGLMYLMLMLAITAGYGLAWVRAISIPSKSTNKTIFVLAHNAGNLMCLVLICMVLAIGIPSRQQTLYNQFIDNEDYQAFTWISDHLDERYSKAILDPWKATAFTAITQKNVYTRIHEQVKTSDSEAYDFLQGGCIDTSFLRENGISIVYGECDCDNPELIEVRNGVYLFTDTEAK